jgi:aspartyl-tRNA(Asn)/glutamyl-tRNA(Gln) amidotransferase subunit A
VVGFKPSQDVVRYGAGFAEPFWGVSMIAPMGRTVDDCALLFEVLSGMPGKALPPSRIGYSPAFGTGAAVDADVRICIDNAIAVLENAGWRIEPIDFDWPEGIGEEALMPLQHAGLAMLYGNRWRAEPALFDPDIGAQIERGLSLSGVEVAQALDHSFRLRGALNGVFEQYGLLIGLTAPCVAWPHERLGPDMIGGRPARPRDHAMLTPRFNHAQLPALSLPCGTGRDGLPVGMQMVGPQGSDAALLAAAAEAAAIISYPARRPEGD